MKTIYLFLVVIIAILPSIDSPSQVPNTWIQKANLGGIARYGAIGFSIGAKGYIGTGNPASGSWLSDFWEYDTTTNAWTQKANFGGPGRMSAVGFSIGPKGYIGTGGTGSTLYSDFWEYDPSANTWTQKANFGGGARHEAVGFSIGTKGYIGTGMNTSSTKLNDFWEYDPSSNTWTQKASFGGTPRVCAVGFSINTKGYIGTGYDNNCKNDFWEYDPSSNTWIQKANFGGTTRNFAVGFNIGTQGYIGTGEDAPFGYLSDFWKYDPSSNTWTQEADFGGGLRGAAIGFSIGTRGFTGTGNHSSFEKDFWEYYPGCTLPDPPTNTTPLANQNICVGDSTTLSASGTGTPGWYSAAIGGTWLGGGINYTTPILTMSTTYYVQDSTSCGVSPTRTSIAVTVNPFPEQAGTITGTPSVCAGSNGIAYSVAPIAYATSYVWTLPPNATIATGDGTNSITVNFTASAVSGDITVQGTNSCGDGTISPNFAVTVNPIPPTPVVTNTGDTLHSNVPAGNQWYFEGTLLAGDTSQTYVATQDGYYWDVVTVNGCSSDTSNHKLIIVIGIEILSPQAIQIYPVPNNGRFTISITSVSEETFSIRVYNYLGAKIWEKDMVVVYGSKQKMIDLSPAPSGLYTVIFENRQNQVVKKIIVNK
jgi:N-acetylneuraminic acid mutarotase